MKKTMISKSVLRTILALAIVVLSAFLLMKKTNDNSPDCKIQSMCNSCEKKDICDLVEKDN